MAFIIAALLAGLGVVAGLWTLRRHDARADTAEWVRLSELQPSVPQIFAPTMVAGLPEPARRFLTFAIRPGTPLLRVAEIDMTGQFSLGSREKPDYRPMEARQILAAPDGFVWAMRTRGGMPISGSDSGGWTRFRIFGLVPVARLGGTQDHRRSAYGRYVAEAAIWTPAALLPGPGITWEATGDDTARVTVQKNDLTQTVDVAVDAVGRPLTVSFQRWSNANPGKTYRLQPFGGILSDFREVDGFLLPHKVDAGNMFGTEEYFAFFRAEVTAVRFPESSTT